MDRKRSKTTLFLWVFMVELVSQNLILPVACRSFQDQKNYYSPPDPPSGSGSGSGSGSPPSSGSHGSSSHGSAHHSGGSSGNCGTPPSHGSHHHTPSHGSGGGSHHTPSPSHGSGGGSYGTPPSTPSTPTPTPSTPTDPSPPSGGGGYYNNPPTSGSPPYTPTPLTPIVLSPPPPNTPTISTPPSPLYPDPNSPPVSPGTCTYWRSHPDLIWALFGWWGTLGSIMGLSPSTPHVFGSTGLTLPQALDNKRTDGIGALYREGTASLLNSMVNTRFPFSTEQVRDRFAAALVSNKAANSQAEIFRKANEGRL